MKPAQHFAFSTVLASFFAAVSLSHAQMGGMDMKGMEMKGVGAEKKSEAKSHKGVGTVKKVDLAASTVTIAHDPIKSMNWPAMNMTFAIKDNALLGRFSQDKKVEFEFVQRGSDYVITSVK